jgi:hypothetical protein
VVIARTYYDDPMELRGERARTFVAVRKLLGRGIVTGGDAEELMGGLTQLFRAQSAVITQGFSFAGWNVAVDVPATWFSLYARHGHEDPSKARLAGSMGETFLIDRDSTVIEKQRELYHHLLDQGFRDGLIATLYNPFVADLAMVMYRAAGSRAFDETDDELFRMLYPHLAGGLAARRALAALEESPRETLQDVLARLDGHVFLSYPSAVVTWSPRRRVDARGERGPRIGAAVSFAVRGRPLAHDHPGRPDRMGEHPGAQGRAAPDGRLDADRADARRSVVTGRGAADAASAACGAGRGGGQHGARDRCVAADHDRDRALDAARDLSPARCAKPRGAGDHDRSFARRLTCVTS